MAGTVNGGQLETPLFKTPPDHTSRNKLDESFFEMLLRCQVTRVIGIVGKSLCYCYIDYKSALQM